MLIATFNVNSIRARLDRFLTWLGDRRPDVLLLQEIKCVDEQFPHREIDSLGYVAVAYGQKTYNGVAILVRDEEPRDVRRGFHDGADEDPQSRIIAATVGDVRVVSVYVPNGGEMGSEKYLYKRAWLRRFEDWLRREQVDHPRMVVGGDFNVALEERDVANPSAWQGSALYNPEIIDDLRVTLGEGWSDTLRLHHQQGGLYSWWDYRQLGFPRNDGLRIDYVFATKALATTCVDAWIDREERKGEKASDHAPVFARFG